MKTLMALFMHLLLLQTLGAQHKYFEKSIGSEFTQSIHEIEYYNENSLCLGGGYFTNPTSFEKVKLIFSNDQIENQATVDYGADFGGFVIRDMIATPTGFAISGRMNNGVTAPFTGETYDYQYLMETDFEGNLINFYDLREFLYQGDAICMLYYPETNTYYVGGEAFISTMPTSMWLMKITNGEIIWRRYYDDYDHRNTIWDLLPSPDGGVYTVGDIDVNTGFYLGNYNIMKITPDGTTDWSDIYSVGYEDRVTDGLLTDDGGFLLSGGSNLPNPTNNRLYATLLRLDSTRNTIWSRQYLTDSYKSEIAKSYQLGNDFVCIGNIKYAGEYIQAFIMKVRGSDGEPLWVRFYDNGISHDYFYNFTPVPQPFGGFICVGRTDTIELLGSDLWSLGRGYIVKTNCMGLLTLPQAAFTISQDPDLPSRFLFTNQSQYAYPDSIDGGYYVWHWGDASPPFICGQGYEPCTTNTLPHSYQTEGIYGVTLQAIVCNDTSTQTQAVCLGFSPNPQAAFSYQDFGGTILFTNLSQNAYTEQGGYYTWHFGDGSPATSAENPAHVYEENGSYTVSLTLVVCQDTSVYTQEIAVQTVGLPPNPITPLPPKGGNTILVYPNPAQNTLTFALNNVLKSPSGDLGVRLVSLTGQTVLETTLAAGELSKTISVAHLPVGLYLYVVSGDTDNGGKRGSVLARGKVTVMR